MQTHSRAFEDLSSHLSIFSKTHSYNIAHFTTNVPVRASTGLGFLNFSVRIAEIWQTIWVIWENGPSWSYTSIYELLNLNNHTIHMGPDCRILQYDSKNIILKIANKAKQKLGPFFSLFLMRKPLSSGQKWFLRPYFPLIRGIFFYWDMVNGLRFSFRALELSEEMAILVSKVAFSSLSVRALSVHETKI